MAKDKNKSIIGEELHRDVIFERADESVDVDKRTVDLCFSSDTPIQHWYGYIILDHNKKSVRLNRLESGGAVLTNHRSSEHIGVVESVAISPKDGKGRATVKISRSQAGTDLLNDVEDGIKRNISVGFRIHELKEELDSDGNRRTIGNDLVYRATDWEPFEISFVALPRDISVGVGRSLEEEKDENKDDINLLNAEDVSAKEEMENRTMADEKKEIIETSTKPATVSAEQRELDRVDEFMKWGERFGEEDLARDLSLESDKSVADLRKAIIEKRAKAQPKVEPRAIVELTDQEKDRYSISRAIRASESGEQCFEREISDEIVKKKPSNIEYRGGIFIPTNQRLVERAGLDAGTATAGAEVVFEEAGSFIDLLRNRAIVLMLGATVYSGLQGNVAFPRQTGAASASWVAENPGSDVAESNLTLDQVQLSPKTLQATTSFSRQLLAQSVVSIDNQVLMDLVRVHALAVDLAALHGTGAANQPEGIYTASGVNSVDFAGPVTFPKIVDMESAIASDNADVGDMAYVTTPEVRGTGKQTQKFSGSDGAAIWQDGEMNGYRAEATNQISKTLGGGTDHGIIFGVWSQLLFGEWGALEIITDPYAKKKQGMIEITSFEMCDLALRHEESFCKGTTLTA